MTLGNWEGVSEATPSRFQNPGAVWEEDTLVAEIAWNSVGIPRLLFLEATGKMP